MTSIVIAMVWQAIGYYMVMYMASMAAVPQSLYESSSLDGANRGTQFFQITIPLIWTNIRTTLTFFIISTINMAFLFVKAMTSGGPNGASEVVLGYMYTQKNNGLYGYCVKTVAVLNCWGRMRSWGCHMVHHALYQKQNYSYAGVIEVLSGAPFDVRFLSFNEVKENPHILDDIDVIVNVGDGDTSHTGGQVWEDPVISSAIRGFVHRGGGFIGVGEPSGHQYQGRYLQLAGVLGVEKETGLTLSYDKYNWEEHPGHFILADTTGPVDFGEGKKSIYALDGTEILVQREKEVQMAANAYGSGRAVYISGLPYSFENSRILYRSILWSSHAEGELHKWFSENFNVEVHAFEKNGKYCVVNNTYEPQDTVVYRGDGSNFPLHLDANEIRWYEIG